MITTIIPTYDRPRRLAVAIESVLSQTYSKCRVVVYDDGGADETETVVRDLAQRDGRVFYVRNSERLGATRNFSLGLEQVQSEYFSFLSDDDRLLPEFYDRALAAFRRYPEAHAAGGVTVVMNESGQVISDESEWIRAGWYPAPYGLIAMLQTRHREWTGMLFRRNVRDVVGLIDARTEVPDLDYMLRTAGVCNLTLFDEPVAVFTLHAGSSTFNLGPRFVYPSYKYLADRLYQDSRIPAGVRQWSSCKLQIRIDRYLARRAVKAVAAGTPVEAREMIGLLRQERGRKGSAALLEILLKLAETFPVGSTLQRSIEWKRQLRRWIRRMRIQNEVNDAPARR